MVSVSTFVSLSVFIAITFFTSGKSMAPRVTHQALLRQHHRHRCYSCRTDKLTLFTQPNVTESDAVGCTRRSLSIPTQLENFQCPGLFDSPKKAYCCGTENNRYCCKLSKAKEHNFRTSDGKIVNGKELMKGVGTALMTVLLVILACCGLCCFCVCYMCKSKRVTRGTVLGPAGASSNPTEIGGQSIHVVNQPPPTGYPSAYPAYPQAPGAAAPQPQQPAYPMYPTANAYPPPPPYPVVNDSAKQPAYNPYYPQ